MKVLFLIIILINNAYSKKKGVERLPRAVTNNAVALIKTEGNIELYSFNGLSQGKTWQHINNHGFRYTQGQWQQLVMPKVSQPVLASTAVSMLGDVYVIGGYTVNAKHEEKSVAEIFKLNTVSQQWSITTKMPVPVDDTVALVYANRYIYLVSGWHDTNNVSLVQVYDSKENVWFKATPYPAPAVFGHAGGIIANKMVICDGVKVVMTGKDKKFVSSPVCMQGVIDKKQPESIKWEQIVHHSGTAYYRMAAVGESKTQRVVFSGGSNNPYNYNGIGYNGIASEASSQVSEYNVETATWQLHSGIIPANMDHRALLSDGEWFYIIGGMEHNQKVSDQVIKFKIPK